MRNLYSGTRHVSRLFSWMSLLLGTLLLCFNVSYARADVRTYGDKNPAARHYAVCHNYAQHLTVAGNLPVTANVTAVPVRANTPDGKPAVAAYDITISDGGREWQPAPGDPVLVTLADKKFVDGKLLDIYHQGPNGPEFVATVMPKNGSITFPGYSFSVYIVGESHQYDRIKVVFKNGTTEIASYYVKPADRTPVTMFKKIVYDPGVGEDLGQYTFFRGWTKNQNYTTATADSAMTIEGVRDDLNTILGGAFSDDTVVTYYAMIFKSFPVTYEDENHVVLHTDNNLLLRTATSLNYIVNMDYTPDDDEHALVGWNVADGGENINGHTSGMRYPNNTTITITGPVQFSVYAPSGNWLVFHENKGTYVPPQFVLSGNNPQVPSQTMERLGYTFGGWYTDSACTTGNEFNFNAPVTTRTHVYAKWTNVSTARYSIIIWKQNINGTDYDFEDLISGTGNVNSSAGTITQIGTGNNAYARINNTNYQYTGFHLKQYDTGVTITPEGTALVNVYYDRTEYTLTFKRSNSGQTYKTITAKYGTYIGDNFPISTGGASADWMWQPTNGNTYNTDNLIIYVDIMPAENINFVRYTSSTPVRYEEFYVETLPGETGTRTFNGKSFKKYGNTLQARWPTFTYAEDFVNLTGYTQFGSDPAFNDQGQADVSAGRTIYLYYTRNIYKINYMDGSYYTGGGVKMSDQINTGQIHIESNITYGANIASYGDYVPATIPAGFVFEGWFLDESCTQPYTFNTMPSNNITVYAKWRQIQYRVFLHPNAGTDPTLDWGSEDQEMNFRVAYGAKVSTPYGRREGTGYEFVGWYTDPACHNVFNGEAYVLNETTVTTPYDKTRDFTDVMDKWGNGATWNSDSMTSATTVRDPERFWITKKFDLYAKWRKVIAGANGIQVNYDAGTGSGAPNDANLYKDNTPAIAGAASTPHNTTDTVFSYWDIMDWNGTEYVPSGDVVYPGGDYTVLLDYAQLHREPNTSDPSVYDTSYVLQLRAHYEAKESKTPTFILWYKNDGTDNLVRQDGIYLGTGTELHINEAVTIPAAPTRTGFTFKGWLKGKYTGTIGTQPTSSSECEPDFLYYNNTTNKYYKEQAYTNEATQVAADEANPYDYLYAIWEPDTITFNIPDEFCYGAEGGTYTLPTTSIEDITGTWNPATINTTSPGTYYPVFTPANGQCITEQVKDTIVVLNPTVAEITGDDKICLGESTTLSVPDVTGNTYKWNTGSGTATLSETNSITVTPTATTHYYVTVTSGGCQSEGDTTVTVYTLPVVNSITVPTGDICPGTGPFNVTGNVTAGTGGAITTYTWDGDATAANAASTTVAEPTAATERCNKTYSVTLKVADDKGCESDPKDASFTVKDDAAPTIATTSLDRTLTSTNCTFIVPDLTGEVRAISSDKCTAQAGLNITQEPAAGTTLTAAGTQKVTVTVTDSCGKSTEKEISLTVPGKPNVVVTGDNNVCYDGTLTLNAEGNGGTGTLEYVWDDASHTTGATLTLSNQTDTTAAHTVNVTVTDANGCTATGSHTYNVYKPLKGGRILYEKHACNTGDTTVVVTGTTPASGGVNGKYVWESSTDNATWDSIPGVNTESYTLPAIHHLHIRRAYVTDCGTEYTNTVYIENSGNVNVGTMTGDGNAAYCYGSAVSHTMTASSVTLASGSPFNYEWYTSTDGTNWTKIDTATHQSFTYTDPNFTSSTSIYFKYAIAISGCDVIFANQQVKLDVNPLPEVTITSNATQTIDLGEVITDVKVAYANGTLALTGMPAGVTNTSTSTTPVTISGVPTTSGTYTVKATVTSNTTPACGTVVDSFKIIVNDTLVLVPFNFDPTPICVQTSETNKEITISEDAGNTTEYTYTWNAGTDGTIVSGQGTKQIVAQWSSSGQKHVTLTVKNNATHAESHKDAYITVNPVPAISIADIAEVCPGATFDVTGTVTTPTVGDYTYTWSGLSGNPAPVTESWTQYTAQASTAAPDDCGSTKELKLTVKDGNSCQVSTTKNITVKRPAAPTISTSLADNDWGCTAPTSVPQVSDFTVTDECAVGTPVVSLTRSDTTKNDCDRTLMWTASYTNACGATATKSITYTWKEMTKPVITTTLNLDSTLTCNWSGTEPQQSDFTVTDGCNTSATATVTAGTLDESVSCQRSRIWTATYQNTCGMKADTVMVKYTWPYDESKPAITAFDTMATPALNCKYEMPDLSAATLRRSTDGCSTPTFVSQSITAGTSYDQTASEQTILVTVTVKDDCGNEQTQTVNVTIPAALSVTAAAAPATICLGSTSELTATVSNATGTPTYSWTPAATLSASNTVTVTATPTAAGNSTYTVTVSDENGCENTASVTVTVNDTVKLTATNLTQNVCLNAPIADIVVTAENATLSLNAPAAAGLTLSGNTITGTPTAVGSYNFTITATSNKTPACQVKTLTGTITVGNLNVTATADSATCINKDGKATVTVTGGTAPITYVYAYKYPSATHSSEVNLTDINNLNTATPTGLDTAVYVVTATDVNGCTASAEFTVSLKNNLTVDVTSEPQHICSGGSFVITPTAPTGTTYTWGLPTQSVTDGVTGTTTGADQPTVHGENLVNTTTSTVELTYSVTPKYGICEGASKDVKVAVDVTTHPVPTITVKDTTVCANIGNVGLTATFASVTAAVDTVSWKFLADSVAHLNAVSSSDLTDNYTAAVPATPCNNQTYPYVVYYADEFGCHSQATANVIVSMPATITFTGGTNASIIECAADTVAPHLISPSVMPTVKDACDNDISDQWTLTRPTNKVDCEGTMEFVYTYKNCDDKTAQWTYTYTIDRTTPPAQVGGPVATFDTVECFSVAASKPHERAGFTMPVVKDVCGNVLPVPEPSISNGYYTSTCHGDFIYTYTYTDCAGLSYVWKYTSNVKRSTPPTVNATGIEAAKTVVCVDSAKAPARIPTATGKCEDAITGVLTATTDNPSPLTCEGTRTYTYTYTDCAGLTATWDYVYTITKGDFTLPANESKDIACASDTVMPTPPATPATYCGDLTVTGPVRGGTYDGCSGTKTYTWTYTDCSGNYTHNWTYTYNIAKPAAPALTGTWPSDQTDVNSCYADRPAFPTNDQVKALYTASCGKELTVTSTLTETKTDNCDWEVTNTYTITDGCTPVTNTITYKGGDKTKPVIATGYTTTLPADVTSCNYTYPDFTASVKDASSDLCTAKADLKVTQIPAYGSAITLTATEQTLPVKVYVEDLCGNKDSVSVTVTVPASIALTIDTSASNCYGQADGFLNYTITGGVANYTLDLTGTTAGADTKTAAGSYSFNNLADGTYSLKVTDANGCEATATTTIQQINTTLQITANSNSWTYDGSAHSDNGFTVTFGSESHTGTSGSTVTLANGDVIGNVTISGSITNVTESPVANTIAPGITITRSGNDVTCFYNIDTTFGKLTITNSGDLALNCVDQSKTYDGTALSYTAVPTVTTGTTVSYSTDGGATWSTTVPSITNVSESPLTVNVKAENSNYTTATCSYTLTINPAPLTIKLDSTKIYDGTAFVSDYASTPAGYTITGLVSGDAVTAGAVTSSDMHKGDYVYNATASITTPFATTKGIGNYNVTYDLTQHIDCRDVTLTSGTTSRKYDGTALSNNTVTVSGSGWLSGKEATYSDFATITDKGSKKNAFTYTLASGEVATDYCVTIDTGMLTVTCREITITAASANYDYDGNVHTNTAFTVTGDGMVSGESVTPVIEGSIQFPSQSPQTNAITGYTFNPATTADNYCVTTVDGTLTMKCVEKNITIVADNGTWTYDGTSHTQNSYTVTYMDGGSTITATVPVSANGVYKFANGDSLHVVITGEAKNVTTGVNNVVAGYTIYHGTENMAACYNVTTTNGTLVVNCRAITLTSATANKTYDNTELKKETVTIGGDGMATGETMNFTNFASITNVGSVKNTFDYSFVSPALASNYCVTVDTGTLTVECREVTIKAKGATKEYDATPLTESGFTVTGLATTDSHIFAVAMTAASTITDAGEQVNEIATVDGIAVTTGVSTAVGNYCVTTDTGLLVVTVVDIPASVVDMTCPTGGDTTRMYDGTPLAPSVTAISSLSSSDVFDITYSTDGGTTWSSTPASVTHVSEGTKNVKVRATNPNYKPLDCDFTMHVTCRKDTLLSNAATKVYDSTPLENTTVTVKGDGFLTGEEPTYSNFATITNVGKATNTFDYTFPTTVDASDYCITMLYDTLEVTCKEVTIKSNGAGKTYDALPLTEPGFTATALEATDPHTFVVAMSSASTITNVGKQPNIIETVDGVAVTLGSGNVVGNYCVTIEADTLEVVCMPVTITAQSKTKEFDGTPLTWDGFDATALATTDLHVFTVKMTAASTITNAGSTPNVIDSVDGVHVEPGVSTAVGNYCVTAQNGTLKITPRPLLILDTLSNKMYDGDTLRVEYSEPEVEAIGLVTGDFLTAGQLSTDNYIAGYYRYEYTAPLSTAVMSEGNALISSPFATDKGISNYTVSYKVKLTITPRPLEITAASDSKVYDCVDLEKDAYSITGGALATTDHIDTVFVTGLQHCVGSSANVPSGAIILHGVDTVTGSYNITYVNGLLEILPITTGFVCPADLDITLWHSTCDTNVTLPAEATLSPSLPAGCVSITNNLVNPLPAGVHTITWSLKDECGNLMTTCDQTITVNYAKCDTAVDYDGNKYPSERIGCNCWTVPNLKSEHYSDGTDIANYTRYDDKDSLENIYGKLYSWYSAARVAEDDNTAVPADSTSHSGPYVEGVCPAGWALPTVAEYLEMFAASGSDAGLVKSPSTEVWLPGKQGTAPNKFNAYGAGYYDGSIHRYLNLLAETHFWAADNANGSATAKNFVLNYYCSDGLVEDALKGLGYSIRCIQKK